MKSNVHHFWDKSGKYVRFLLYLLSIVLITFALPNQRKFMYEYQKGSPWLHENLIAPYSFTIYKLSNEISNEKDSIKQNIQPYFRKNEQVKLNQQNLFKLHFDSIYKKETKNDKKEIQYLEQSLQVFDAVYEKGVIEYIDEFEKRKINSIVIIKENISEEFVLTDFFTLKTSYTFVIKEFTRIFKQNKNIKDTTFIKKLHINEFILPNILYDKVTTEKITQAKTNSISLTRGMIQKGEAIISQGEIVNLKAFRILESYRKHFEYESSFSNINLIFIGQFFLVSISIFIFYLFLRTYRNDIFSNTRQILFLLFLKVLFVFLTVTFVNYSKISIFVFPYILLPIIIKVFFDARVAFLSFVVAVLMVGFVVPNGFHFSFMQIIVGFIAIISLASLTRRGNFFTTSVYVFLSYSFIYVGISLIQEGSFMQIEWKNLVYFAINGLLLLTVYPLIFIFEKTFKLISDLTLIELSDLNQPLLRKLAEQAPGTFQHSLQVSNLAVEAIYEIGGNALLARAGALYHDIGKIVRPQYFVENQRNGINPHEKLDNIVSAKYIINHIQDGVNLAHKYKLHRAIIDFITTHHGESKVEYFLRTYKNENPGVSIDESKFTYPGPNPKTRENAVVMMADSVEAATRSLKDLTPESIDARIDMVINHQLQRQLFYESDITFKDISKVKEVFKNKIKTIYHARIEYPEAK